MELRDSAAAAKRFIHGLLSGRGPKRYVVEVDGICAEAFDIPGTEICEYWGKRRPRLRSLLSRAMTYAPQLGRCKAFDVSA